jgi:hypothetical protein
LGLVAVAAVALGVGRIVERVTDLDLPTPVETPPFLYWVVALAAGWLAGVLGRVACAAPQAETRTDD